LKKWIYKKSSKPSRASQRQVNGLCPPLTAPSVLAGGELRGDSKKVLPSFSIIEERVSVHD